MPPGPIPATNGTFANILHLDYLTVTNGIATFNLPFLNGPAGLKYLDQMPHVSFRDETENQEWDSFDLASAIMLGDIWGMLAEKQRLPKLTFGGFFSDSGTSSLPAGGVFAYDISVVPPATNATFGSPNTYVFGKMSFGYGGDFGNIRWGKWNFLNFEHGIVYSEAENPVAVAVYLHKGVQLQWLYDEGPTLVGCGMNIAGEVESFMTGNLPSLNH